MKAVEASPTQQAVILLALITSSLITVRDGDMIPNDSIKTVVNMGILRLYEIIKKYPSENGESFSETSKIMQGLDVIINKPKAWFSYEVVVYLGHKVCADLLGELCNPVKRKMVEEANEILGVINDFSDPDGEDEQTHSEVEEILEGVYNYIGFSVENRYYKQLKKRQRRLKQHGRTSC